MLTKYTHKYSCRDVVDAGKIRHLQKDIKIADFSKFSIRLQFRKSDSASSDEFHTGSIPWLGGRVVREPDLRSTSGGFESRPPRCRVQNGKVVHTHVSLSPSSIIWYRQTGSDAQRLGRLRYSRACRKVNSSLPPGLRLRSPAS